VPGPLGCPALQLDPPGRCRGRARPAREPGRPRRRREPVRSGSGHQRRAHADHPPRPPDAGRPARAASRARGGRLADPHRDRAAAQEPLGRSGAAPAGRLHVPPPRARGRDRRHPRAVASREAGECASLESRLVRHPYPHARGAITEASRHGPYFVPIRSIYYMTTATTASATKQVAINDIGSAEDFLAAVELTLKFFNDGDLIEGTVVKIDRDEVLLDVGYKTEGVIPSRELSIKHDVDPTEVVSVGDSVEALVLQKEDKEGRLILSKKRAQYERAWGDVEKIKESDGVVTGQVIEVVKG